MCDRCEDLWHDLYQISRTFANYNPKTRTKAQKKEDRRAMRYEAQLDAEVAALRMDHQREEENDPAFLALIEEENRLLQLDIASEDSTL